MQLLGSTTQTCDLTAFVLSGISVPAALAGSSGFYCVQFEVHVACAAPNMLDARGY